MPPRSPCPGEGWKGGREEAWHLPSSPHPTQLDAVAHREGRWSHRQQAPGAWQRLCSAPLLSAGTRPHALGTLGPGYLVATGTGTAVGAKGVIVAAALILTGAGEARVALGLDAQGRWTCGMGGTEMTISARSDGDVSFCGHMGVAPQSLWGCWEQSLSKRLCTRQWDSHRSAQSPGKCHQSGKRMEATWFPSSTRRLNRQNPGAKASLCSVPRGGHR